MVFLKIPLMAKKESPKVNLPEILDIQSSWIGANNQVVFKIKNQGGEAGFRFFCEDEEDD